MNNAQQLAARLREVILDGTFVAYTNFKQQLTDLDWTLATQQVSSLNTIAILAQHIHYYLNGMNNVFRGGMLDIKDKYSFDFPAITGQKDWDDFLERFWNDAEAFATMVAALEEVQLNAPFVNEKYGSYQRNIDAMIEHSYYHLGQIVLIKKLLAG